MDFATQHRELERLIASEDPPSVDAHLSRMHAEFHEHARDHVRVHLAWARVQFQRRAPLRGLGHLVAGLVVAGPASLVQRYTGLVVPAFDARRRA